MSLNQSELAIAYRLKSDAELSAELMNLQNQSFGDYTLDGRKADNLEMQRILQEVMRERGTSMPNGGNPNASQYGLNTNTQQPSSSYNTNQSYNSSSHEPESSMNVGKVALGIILILVGVGISMASSGSIFYGLMIGGAVLVFQGFSGN